MWWMVKPGWAYCSLNKSCPAIHMPLRVYCLSVVPSTLLTPPSFLSAKTGLGVRKNDASRQTVTHLWEVSTAKFSPSGSLLVCAVFFFAVFTTSPEQTRKTEDIIKLSPGNFRPKWCLSLYFSVCSHSNAMKLIHGELVVMKPKDRYSYKNSSLHIGNWVIAWFYC